MSTHIWYDLVCSFAVLKHFSLYEFPSITEKFLSMGKFALFSMQFSNIDLDDGEEAGYHHIWITDETLEDVIHKSNHSVVWQRRRWQGEHHGTTGEERFIFTRRRGDG
jgi:hypothetical protein